MHLHSAQANVHVKQHENGPSLLGNYLLFIHFVSLLGIKSLNNLHIKNLPNERFHLIWWWFQIYLATFLITLYSFWSYRLVMIFCEVFSKKNLERFPLLFAETKYHGSKYGPRLMVIFFIFSRLKVNFLDVSWLTVLTK